jgi:hypothetical protein
VEDTGVVMATFPIGKYTSAKLRHIQYNAIPLKIFMCWYHLLPAAFQV